MLVKKHTMFSRAKNSLYAIALVSLGLKKVFIPLTNCCFVLINFQ